MPKDIGPKWRTIRKAAAEACRNRQASAVMDHVRLTRARMSGAPKDAVLLLARRDAYLFGGQGNAKAFVGDRFARNFCSAAGDKALRFPSTGCKAKPDKRVDDSDAV